MKNLLCCIVLFCCACAVHKKESGADSTATAAPAISQIKFVTGTKGYQKEILFWKDSVFMAINNHIDGAFPKQIGKKLAPEDWQKLMDAVYKIELPKLSTYEAPTNAGSSDGAYQSTIFITTLSGEQFSSGTFDNYSPNEKLKDLLDRIGEIEKTLL